MNSVIVENILYLEAEDPISQVWSLMVRHRIPTPKLHVIMRGSRVDIELTFEMEADRARIAAELQLYAPLRKTTSGRGELSEV